MEAVDQHFSSCGTAYYVVQGALSFISAGKTSAPFFSIDELRKILWTGHTCCQAPFSIISSVSLASAFVPRAAVSGLRYHGDHYHATEVVWNPRAVCYGFTLGFKTGKLNQISDKVSDHISKNREESWKTFDDVWKCDKTLSQ